MANTHFHESLSKFARGLKHLLTIGSLAILVSCSSSTDGVDAISAKSEVALLGTQAVRFESEPVDLMASLAALYPNGQLAPEQVAATKKALTQNPAALSLTAESVGLVKSQSALTTIQPQATAADFLPVTRVQNTTLYGAYFFSIYPTEVSTALATNRNWRLEGPAFWASLATGTDLFPVHRFQNKQNGSYLYTIYDAERADIAANYSATFAYEGVAWYARQAPGTGWSPLYRFRNKTNGTYLFSAYESEKDAIVANFPAVFELEGIAYYVRQDAPVVLTSLSISVKSIGSERQEPFRWAQGDVRTLQIDARYSNGTTAAVPGTWSSSNPNVAAITAVGVLSTLSPGNTVIAVTYGGITATKDITVATPLATPLITITCNSAAPTVISAATWNAQASNDSENSTKWIVVDGATCGTRSDLQLIYKTSASATSGTRIFQAFASPNGSFYPGRILTSASNVRMSVGSGVDVGYEGFSPFSYYLHYTIIVQ
jgi:Repeat of unknown function (DUF5648)